jgi:hypothetical protein
VEISTMKIINCTGSVASSEVTTLKHELRDDSVERGALVPQSLALGSGSLLSSAQSSIIKIE